jgi:hypothetical protein
VARSGLHEGNDGFKPNYLPKVQRLASGASSTGRTITNLKQKEYEKELFYPD